MYKKYLKLKMNKPNLVVNIKKMFFLLIIAFLGLDNINTSLMLISIYLILSITSKKQ